jgi:hypothetical protein
MRHKRYKIGQFSTSGNLEKWLNEPENQDYEVVRFSAVPTGSSMVFVVVLECTKQDAARDVEYPDPFAVADKTVNAFMASEESKIMDTKIAVWDSELRYVAQRLSMLAARYPNDVLLDAVKTKVWGLLEK